MLIFLSTNMEEDLLLQKVAGVDGALARGRHFHVDLAGYRQILQ